MGSHHVDDLLCYFAALSLEEKKEAIPLLFELLPDDDTRKEVVRTSCCPYCGGPPGPCSCMRDD